MTFSQTTFASRLKQIAWSIAGRYATTRLVHNHFGTNFGRRALLSHVTYPYVLRVRSLSHTNVLESKLVGRVLSDLCYDVDVVQYDSRRQIDFSAYDLIIGFGDPLINAFRDSACHAVKIGLFAGMHNYYQNMATLIRVKEVHAARGRWLLGSGRFVDRDWTAIAELADAVIVTGNQATVDSYEPYVSRPVYRIPATYHQICDVQSIIGQRDPVASAKTFLWFGGHGLIHKGLDLVLEAFAQTPELNLHVCAPIHQEPEFVACYYRELYETPNITSHGFVSLNSPTFRELLLECGFVVFASCAEGGSSSVITAIANGGLIPVVTRASAVDIDDFGVEISELTPAGVQQAVRLAADLPQPEYLRRGQTSLRYCAMNNTSLQYASKLREILSDLLGVSTTG